jgi:hypothetical protein
MKRPSIGLYIAAALELVAGTLLSWGGISIIRVMARGGRPRTDDLIGAMGLAPSGIGLLLAGIFTILAIYLPRGIVRSARIVALASEVWLMLAGAAMYAYTRHEGGDWAGVGYLAAIVLLVIGALLLFVSWLGLRSLRRAETSPNSTGV